MNRPALALLTLALAACSHGPSKKDWSPAPADADRASCEAKGGRMTGPHELGCVTPFPDAGKPCADASECVGECFVYSIPYSAVLPAGRKKGVCQKANRFTECYRAVTDGVVEPGSHCRAY